MIQKNTFNFPIICETSVSIVKAHNLGLTTEKIRDHFYTKLKELHHTEIEILEENLIKFTNNKFHFLLNRFKNSLGGYNYGELSITSVDEYWIINFKGEMKRHLIKSCAFAFLILLFNLLGNFLFIRLTMWDFLGPLVYGLVYFAIGYATSGFRIRGYLIRKKNELETWGN
jgi:hypothetical protein